MIARWQVRKKTDTHGRRRKKDKGIDWKTRRREVDNRPDVAMGQLRNVGGKGWEETEISSVRWSEFKTTNSSGWIRSPIT